MTDQPGRPPEERLPAPRPSSAPAPASRFSAPPSAHRNDLTPERAGRIVRQSANARWVGFLAVTLVGLFVIGYYFYELGLPGGLSEPRLEQAAAEQQVISVERGYNLYEANCAQCHGANGEGGIGPVLNRQDKLFAHLNPEYLRNVLTAGGRYVCGNADSVMPVWSNQGNPPGPLNYKQIDYLIAFIRASKDETFRVLDPELAEPVVDPVTGQEETFTGWVDPNYAPEPGATPYPACWADEFTAPQPSSAPSSPAASGDTGASQAPTGTVIKEQAFQIAFVNKELSAPADTPFQIEFENQDAGVPHNIEIKDANGGVVFKGEIFNGVDTKVYDIPALPAGTYPFVCTVHPNMTGTLKVGS
jgi:mono/diheme cytochrome c family protein/plastocyanin